MFDPDPATGAQKTINIDDEKRLYDCHSSSFKNELKYLKLAVYSSTRRSRKRSMQTSLERNGRVTFSVSPVVTTSRVFP
jgi:hypothetical protein